MKTKYLNKFLAVIVSTSFFVTACNESRWLEETPYDFYTSENSYKTTAQFQQALNYLYDEVRALHWKLGDQHVAMFCGDIGYGATDPDNKFNNFKTFFTPYTYVSGTYWDPAYSVIANANVIINRIDMDNEVSEDDKKIIKGQALFFRAYFYNLLANLFGGVPLVVEEPLEPKRDFVQVTREEVYDQARKDLEESVNLLNDITKAKDGEINIQAAQHLLTEVYLSLKQYPKAIETATKVIDNPAMGLMKHRFGSRKDEVGKDVYWDLFQNNNQNRSSGNTETIWALQYEYKNSGSSYSTEMPRWLLPFYAGLQVPSKKDPNTLVAAFPTLTEEKGGRGIGCIRPTDHFLKDIWKDSPDDYRNSSYMIVRDFRIENEEAAGHGEYVVSDGWLSKLSSDQQMRNFYPFIMKFSRIGDLPEDNYAKNDDGSYVVTNLGEHGIIYQWGSLSANTSMKDEYMYRLAGTYLLRAEAYLMNNEPDKAMDDLNEIRRRSNAPDISVDKVNIDFILDEQLRELYFEDFRLPTLCRLGVLVDRSKKYNPYGHNVGDYQNLLPIPYSEIEKNIYGKLEQNPGYEGF